MEQLLHYLWKHKIFSLQTLQTTAGVPVEVIDPGLHNTDAGPDFFNAKLKIGGALWVGNVEIHHRASDWFRHGHQKDRAYDSVVLHVVAEDDARVTRTNGEPIAQLVMECAEQTHTRYRELCEVSPYPPCHTMLPMLPRLTIHSWMAALQAERLEQKAAQIEERVTRCGGNWEDAFFVTLARNYGFGLNGDAFEAWALLLPFRALDKHRDDLFQTEAIFYGVAGLLEAPYLPTQSADQYALRLCKEFRYLQQKFGITRLLDGSRWRFLRLRPDNFPHIRLAQLAHLYCQSGRLFSRLLEAETPEAAYSNLSTRTSAYWEEHYNFSGATSPRRVRQLGQRSKELIVINTLVPFLYAYGQHKADRRLQERAICFLEALKAEDNHLLRSWAAAGLPAENAADSQALIQLRKEYCDRRRCLYCRFGYEYMKSR